MSNDPRLLACCFDQAAVINFPKPQAERIRCSIALPHRVRDFKWIAHDDQRFQIRQEALPEWERQAVTRILPAPHTCRIESFEQQPRFHPQGAKPTVFERFI